MAADEIRAPAHPFPESVAGDDDRQVRVRFALLGVIKAAAERLDAHHREEIFGSEEGEAAPHLVLGADARDCEPVRGHVGEDFLGVLAQFPIFVIRKLPVIVVRALPRGENVDHFLRLHRHHGAKDHAIDERENRRVHPDREREGDDRDNGEPRCLNQLPKRKPKILDHRIGPFR